MEATRETVHGVPLDGHDAAWEDMSHWNSRIENAHIVDILISRA